MAKINSRGKGAAGEREWAERLRDAGWPDAKRDIEQSREGGGDVPAGDYLYEVKRYARFAVYEHMDQAYASAKRKGKKPAVALRGNNREWLVLVPADDFLQLVKRAEVLT